MDIGKNIIIIVLIIVLIGIIILIGGKLGLGNLPGDIVIKKENFTFAFPIVTSIVISIILTVIINIIRKFF
jgi:heme/copper-type cytochrome/quinol oxidase subunit 2